MFAIRGNVSSALICGLCVNLPAPMVAHAAVGERMKMNLINDEIVAKARLDGSVRVIVELRIAAGSDDGREQRIIAAQQALLGELADVAHRVVRSFTAAPMLALEVSYDALQVLIRSAQVLYVDGDGLAAPMNNVIEGKE
jgi:hypothetical protein